MENQFIQFTRVEGELRSLPHKCELPMPVYFGDEGIAFFVPETTIQPYFTMHLTNIEGDMIEGSEVGGRLTEWRYIDRVFAETSTPFSAAKAKTLVAPNEVFRICIFDNGCHYYSSPLIRHESKEGLSLIKYRCVGYNGDFGLPWNTQTTSLDISVKMWLSIALTKPNYKQKDNVYEKMNGEKVVLFSQITKEYQCETDYMPEEWHKRLLIALCCDEVYINGERLTKTDDYEMDWDNVLTAINGIKCAKAAWKMTSNVTQRNSI